MEVASRVAYAEAVTALVAEEGAGEVVEPRAVMQAVVELVTV